MQKSRTLSGSFARFFLAQRLGSRRFCLTKEHFSENLGAALLLTFFAVSIVVQIVLFH